MKIINKVFVSSLCALLLTLGSCSSYHNGIKLADVDSSELHTTLQKTYLEGKYDALDSSINGRVEKSKPNQITINWESQIDCSTFNVYVSEDKDFSSYQEYETNKNTITLSNLKVNTKYYYKVNGLGNDSQTKSFTTCSHLPRNIDVDKITNVRDLGGYKTSTGDIIPQGKVYRGSKLNYNTEEDEISAIISQAGIDTFTNVLKIKTEIDLRELSANGINDDTLAHSVVDGVNYVACPMGYKTLISEDNYPSIIKVFETFADKDAYPIYFHCSIGTDRTGLIAYLLNGLLGVSQEDLFFDYLFSNFGSIGSSRSLDNINDQYVTYIDSLPGKDLSEHIEYFLASIGVKEIVINRVRENMAA